MCLSSYLTVFLVGQYPKLHGRTLMDPRHPRWTRTPPPAAPLAGVVVHESDRLRGERLLADLELEGVLAGRERALAYVHGPETMEVVARLHRRRGRAGEVDRVRTVEYVLPALRRG